ncbi:hypothetical protein [Desulfotignum phosphitoxidans]|uniref:Uncharacterized protein n=1 Tax=Desulfotignum phosphitoxidans DSM 13687 TaxID=1286635 RepID=S0G274_9BACT|nr:hypothetical protein [Desulfotignum phosphitoxidans]EMS81448.1 hypothetical protein Dpo_1c05890 [Desulfotignum phosphitoxidans DSM 13687]
MTSTQKTDNYHRSCPKCGHIKAITELECPKCGIVYEKYEKLQNRRKEEAKLAKEQEAIKKEKHENTKQQHEEKRLRREHFKQKSKNKIKKLFKPSLKKISIALLILCVTGVSAFFYSKSKYGSEYIANLKLANSIMALSTIKCVEMSEQYSTVWREAIEDKYNSDFSDDIREQRRKFELYGDIRKIDESKKLAEELLQKLNQPNEPYPQAHKKIVELYGVYSQLHSLAQSPSGSLMTYNKKVNDLQSQYIKIVNELKVLLPKEK